MTRTFATLLFGGVAALGLTLASPQQAPAQTPFGVQLNVGPAGFAYQQGYATPVVPAYPNTGVYGVPAPVAPVVTVPAPYVYPRPYYPYYPQYRGWNNWHHYGHYHRR